MCVGVCQKALRAACVCVSAEALARPLHAVWFCMCGRVFTRPQRSLYKGLNLMEGGGEWRNGELFLCGLNSFRLQARPCRDLSLYNAAYCNKVCLAASPSRRLQRCKQMKRDLILHWRPRGASIVFFLLPWPSPKVKSNLARRMHFWQSGSWYWLTFTIRGRWSRCSEEVSKPPGLFVACGECS